MSGMPIIEVAIGLSFMFLVLSFCASAIAGSLTEIFQWRGRLLHAKLESILGKELTNHLYSERNVASLASGTPPAPKMPDLSKLTSEKPEFDTSWPAGIVSFFERWKSRIRFSGTSLGAAKQLAIKMNAKRLPSYIPESVFAGVILDWLQGISLPSSLKAGASNVSQIPFEVAELLQRMNLRANGDQDALKCELVAWFKQVTDQLSDDFKRKIRVVLLIVGIGLAAAVNADALRMAKTLYGNPDLRAQVATTAEEFAKSCPGGLDTCPEYQNRLKNVLIDTAKDASSELMGWHGYRFSWPSLGLSMLGWLLTMLAIALGADFWFAALKKIVSIKSAKLAAVTDESSDKPDQQRPRQADPHAPTARFEPINIETLAPMQGFQPLRFAESSFHAFWMAHFASLAYATKEQLNASALLKKHQLHVTSYDIEGTQAFVFKSETNFIVAFRGTEMLPEDWVTDLDALQVDQPWGVKKPDVKVHKGFHDALDQVWDQLRNELREAKSPVWFTGHSLGGALAVLAAYRLAQCERDSTVTVGGVYTFGQPRVGNSAFAESCTMELSQRIFRYVNSSDIVPLVPPPTGYDHFGNVRYFDATGYLHYKRTLWERISEQLMPGIREVLEGTENWKTVAMENLRQRIADHAMAKYVACVEQIEALNVLRDASRPR